MRRIWKRSVLVFLTLVFSFSTGCKMTVTGDPEKEYTITYDENGHGTAPDKKTVKEGYKLTEEDLPKLVAEGYTFTSWKIGEATVSAGYEVKEDIKLTAGWTVWGKVSTPVINPADTAVDYGDTVTITCATDGAEIHYTTDGTDPTAASSKYTSPIAVTQNMTVKAVAVKDGMIQSDVVSKSFTVKTYKITFTTAHGTAPNAITGKHKGETVTLPLLTASGFTFDRWNDGKTDYAAGSEYTVGTSDAEFSAVWKEWNTVLSPSINSSGTAVDYGDTVTITCGTDGAEIHYTTDGTAPTAASTKYTVPIAVTKDMTLKAIAVKSGMNDSETVSAAFTVKTYRITFTTAHGTAPNAITGKHKGEVINLPQAITETGFTFDRWNDGTSDYAAGSEYTVGTSDAEFSAVWRERNTVSSPSINSSGTAVDYGDTVTITCETDGAEIHYTTDGTAPTAASTKYTVPITVTKDMTLKAIAVKSGMNDSETVSAAFTVKTYRITFTTAHGTAPGAITGKHKGEVINLPQAITETGFTFDRWNDGTKDYTAGSEYTVGTSDAAFSAVWTEWERTANPAVSPSGTAVDYGDTVTITCETGGAEIYYTTDGAAPTAASSKYTSPIAVTQNMTVKAIAVKNGMNDSETISATYTVKTYSVTFTTVHGTSPEAISGKHKGENVTLPQALTDSIWTFQKWTDGQNEYEAGGSYTVGTSDVTMAATWEDITPPADVTGLTASYPQKGVVKLTWTNPADADFAKVVITYGDTGNITVLKDANPANEATITGLTNGTEYTFTVKSYDERNHVSTGVSVTATPHILSPLETKAGVKPENINVTDDIEVFKLEYEIQDSLNVIPESEGKTFNLECYYVEFDKDKKALVKNSGITYQWYKGTTENWKPIEDATDRAYNLTITSGTTYYMLEATCGTAKFYYDISQIYCGAELTANIGKIAYTDGTYSEDLIDGKVVLGIVCEVDAQGNPRKVISKETAALTTVYGVDHYTLSMGYETSYIDGSNTYNLYDEYAREEYPENSNWGATNPSFSAWQWGYDGSWYMPALNELYCIWVNKSIVNTSLVKIGGGTFEESTQKKGAYYSSTSHVVYKLQGIAFGTGQVLELNLYHNPSAPHQITANTLRITKFPPASN